MTRPPTVPYNENRAAHQCPVFAISEWQEWNELDTVEDHLAWQARGDANVLKYERMRHECQEAMQ